MPAGIAHTQWSKNGFFAPPGRHIALIKVKFGTRERTVGEILREGANLELLPPRLIL